MKSPCYDEKTHTDCPKRHAGCAATCPEWAEYDAHRKEVYKKRVITGLANAAADAAIYKYKTQYAKKEIRRKRFNKRGQR